MPDKVVRAVERSDGNAELETQFILRLPALPAASLRSVIASSGHSLKDRFQIQIENDMRHGTVTLDGWSLPAKVVDLPTIIESLKTLDGKTFYKTSDICQMMICKEEMEEERPEGEEKKKDGKEKKFHYPHGVTAPLKNVRKKRFRKPLKKKAFDVPDIEREVKRLFRTDGEAVHVRYEVVNTEEKREKQSVQPPEPPTIVSNNSQSMDLEEHDLFGDVLSSSDESATRAQDSDDESQQSLPPVRESIGSSENKFITEFTPGMLNQPENHNHNGNTSFEMAGESSSAAAAAAVAALKEADQRETDKNDTPADEHLLNRLHHLQSEIKTIREKRQFQEAEITDIDNTALVSRFQAIVDELKCQEMDKRQQCEDILRILNQQL